MNMNDDFFDQHGNFNGTYSSVGSSNTNNDGRDALHTSAFVWSVISMMVIVGICFFCLCYMICSTDDRFHITFVESNDAEGEEERRETRRALILENVIHKKVEKREEAEGITLPYEKDKSSHYHHQTLTIPNDVNTNNNNDPSQDESPPTLRDSTTTTSSSQQNNSRKYKRNKDMNNRSMRSIRRSMNVKMDSTLSLYSPKVCPICMESYHTEEEIAWSSNDECPHAFHLDCIMGWLMEHSNCPMCRAEFLNPVEDNV